MIKVISYCFVEPQYIIAENAKNIHLFEGYFDPLTGHFELSKNESCCGNCRCKPHSYQFYAGCSDEETREHAREVVKWDEDHGKSVCGRCVATLYSDEKVTPQCNTGRGCG